MKARSKVESGVAGSPGEIAFLRRCTVAGSASSRGGRRAMSVGPPDIWGCLARAPRPGCDWVSYVRDAAWVPDAYDARHDTLVFAHLPRDAQRRAVFLDPRFIARAPKSAPAPVADLPAEAIDAAAGPLHF